jgi:hypothetical protein
MPAPGGLLILSIPNGRTKIKDPEVILRAREGFLRIAGSKV